MDLIEVRRILVFGDTHQNLPECMKEDCYEKAIYVLVVTTGPKKGAMYLVCEECLEAFKAKAKVIPIHTN